MDTRNHRKSERGQSFVTMSIGILAFLAVLALAIDGGMTYASRRRAQNAADAGALAGARQLCVYKNDDSVDEVALAAAAVKEYTQDRNGATDWTAVISPTVYVTASVSFDSFFAQLLGFPEITAEAEAEASCVSPGLGIGVLPVGWACEDKNNDGKCDMEPITLDEAQWRGDTVPSDWSCEELTARGYADYCDDPPPLWPDLYIIMTDISTDDEYCISNGGFIDCDLDDDGKDDIADKGGRDWLDLDGSNCDANELKGWVKDGFNGEIAPHTWLAKCSGANADVFHEAQDLVDNNDNVVIIPVFDSFCDENPPGPGLCGGNFHTDHDTDCDIDGADEDYDCVVDGNLVPYYHIIGFAAFYISCVNVNPNDGCPGHDYAVSQDTTNTFKNSTKSVEGYFLTGIVPGVKVAGGAAVDTGIYVLLLTK